MANTAGGLAQRLAARLLDEINACFRGLPANPTTEMDLSLWRLAMTAKADPESRALISGRDAGRLAKAYQGEGLPEALQTGTRALLARYGCRVAAEMDLGLPRWADDPTPVFSTLISYADASGPARIVHDPDTARIEPGEVLVCPSTTPAGPRSS
ncbi:hypothetical protein [Nonomuraea endophytica]|uniref:Uncharacterized protein n=1 Tax=Nonomuraea endophytica TaxID=714136 RepID=A0A7W8A905_9ACTN|nr:hypothetical protein [Nonomuraea endophytica]MBB5081793.1 hypothetical protein [Nonomuraea endophytica]